MIFRTICVASCVSVLACGGTSGGSIEPGASVPDATHWQAGLILATAVASLLLAAGYLYEQLGIRRDARLHPAPGQLVVVDGRKLHLLCKGTAAPTIVVEQGAGELARFWWPLQEQAAGFARVCTYDRAGFGWSEPAPSGRTVADRAEDMRLLLANAGVPGPFILVAHSYGGLIVRRLAVDHPELVAGLILVDTPDESTIFDRDVLDFYSKIRIANRVVSVLAGLGVLRLLRRWANLDRYGFWLSKSVEYAALCDDLASLELVPAAERSSQAPGSLGTLPLAVITHGIPFPGPFAVLEKSWSEGQRRLAALSSNSSLLVAAKSNHMIQQDQPDVVLDAMRRMHEQVRKSAKV